MLPNPPAESPPGGTSAHEHAAYFYGVTNRDIFNQLTSLQGQLTTLVTQGSQSAREIVDHEARLRSLEKNRWPLASITALIAVAALFLPFFIK